MRGARAPALERHVASPRGSPWRRRPHPRRAAARRGAPRRAAVRLPPCGARAPPKGRGGGGPEEAFSRLVALTLDQQGL